MILDKRGRRGGIVGQLVDVAPAGQLLRGNGFVLFALFDGSEQAGKKVGIESNGHRLASRNHVDGGLHQRINYGSDLCGGLVRSLVPLMV